MVSRLTEQKHFRDSELPGNGDEPPGGERRRATASKVRFQDVGDGIAANTADRGTHPRPNYGGPVGDDPADAAPGELSRRQTVRETSSASS